VNPDWIKRHPEDIDLITHELMHVIQAGRGAVQPGWLIEGSADYARAVYGVDNLAAHWGMAPPGPQAKYTDGYRVTGRFLVWLEAHGHKGIVKEMADEIREGKYKEKHWKKLSGENIDQLWADYVLGSAVVIRQVGPPPTPERLEQARRLIEQLGARGTAGRPLQVPVTPAIPASSTVQPEASHP